MRAEQQHWRKTSKTGLTFFDEFPGPAYSQPASQPAHRPKEGQLHAWTLLHEEVQKCNNTKPVKPQGFFLSDSQTLSGSQTLSDIAGQLSDRRLAGFAAAPSSRQVYCG
jgi:hypothetical protein